VNRFKAEALAFLARYVPLTGAVFYEIDARFEPVDQQLLRIEAGVNDAYVSCYHLVDPFHPRRFADSPLSVVSIRDIGGPSAFAASEYYREFLAPQGIRFKADLLLRHRGAIVGGICLLRASERGDFSPDELTFLSRVRPLIEAGCIGCRLDRERNRQPFALGQLSARENDVVELVCTGASNDEIGRALHISQQTVKSHLRRVYAKVGIRSRAQLMALAHGCAPATAASDSHQRTMELVGESN
jgi:DNA-binding CsgD family transcriptional regulator